MSSDSPTSQKVFSIWSNPQKIKRQHYPLLFHFRLLLLRYVATINMSVKLFLSLILFFLHCVQCNKINWLFTITKCVYRPFHSLKAFFCASSRINWHEKTGAALHLFRAAGMFKNLVGKYSRLWNRRSPWNNHSPPLKNFHIMILILFYINLCIAVIF